jgi:hypothetical protein
MTLKAMQRAAWGWSAIALSSAAWQLTRPAASRRAETPHRMWQWDSLGTVSVSEVARQQDQIIRDDPFGAIGLDEPTPHSGGVWVPPVPPPYAAPKARTRLSAIVGPPWRAIIALDGPQPTNRTVEVGDTVLGARVMRISMDAVALRAGGTTVTRALGASWQP